MKTREKDRRAAWYREFQFQLIKAKPELAGKINWSEVEYGAITDANITTYVNSYIARHGESDTK